MEEEPMVHIKGKDGYATEPVCTFEEQPVYRLLMETMVYSFHHPRTLF